MDQSDFSILVGRLEREADERPQLYAARVAGVAALGYLALALVGAIILFACYQVVRSQIAEGRPSGWMMVLGVGAVATLIAMVRALWVRPDAPSGRPITAEEAPQLFALIDDVARRIEGPALATVTINSEFDASIRQIPRWGVFGGYHNHLELGVPLIAALSVDEFTAVLAHEMGHLCGDHGKFSAWIYRQRRTWAALQRKFAEPQPWSIGRSPRSTAGTRPTSTPAASCSRAIRNTPPIASPRMSRNLTRLAARSSRSSS